MSTISYKPEKQDLCRCCHIEGSFQNISAYLGVLKYNLGIDLISVPDVLWAMTICQHCIEKLHTINSFKAQVLKCEENFKEIYRDLIKGPDFAVSVTIKPEWPVSPVLLMHENIVKVEYIGGDDDAVDVKVDNTQNEKPPERTSTNTNIEKSKSKTTKIKPLTTNDTKRKVKSKTNINKKTRAKAKVDAEDQEPVKTKRSGADWKAQRKYNDSLRENITLLLYNSTITPFRYLNAYNYRYTCQYCDENYHQFELLKGHVAEKHANLTAKEIFATVKQPTEFVKADISDIRCKICDNKFDNIENILEHLIETHKKLYHNVKTKPSHGIIGFVMNSSKFRCHICDEIFKSFRKLFGHMPEHCENYVCSHCGKKFLSSSRLQNHENQHKTKTAKCMFCEETFNTFGARAYHMRKIHNHGRYKCYECEQCFDQDQQRLDHLILAHNFKKPDSFCTICSKDYANTSSLKKHMNNIHLRSKEYRCHICGKSFTYKTSLDGHLRGHSGVKDLECQFCHKKFGAPNTLRVHMRGHLNERRFVCPLCEAAFIQKVCLKSHIRVHHPHSNIDLNSMTIQRKTLPDEEISNASVVGANSEESIMTPAQNLDSSDSFSSHTNRR